MPLVDNSSYIVPEMVEIEAGSFMMGSDENSDEQPIHEVTIEKPFLIGKYQVTFDEYDLFCDKTKRLKPHNNGWGRGKQAVINVSRDDVKEYISWLSKKTRERYYLPSEAEWEYVCRAGSTTSFNIGDSGEGLKEYAWYDDNACDGVGESHKDYGPHKVGEKRANAWGVHDILGNVWEWCEDAYDDSYEKVVKDRILEQGGQQLRKVLRGGSWDTELDNLRSSNRLWYFSSDKSASIGFRLAKKLKK